MKRAFLIIGIGFAVGLVLMVGAFLLNVRYSAPGGPEIIPIPRYLRGWTLLCLPALSLIVQITALVLSIRSQFSMIPGWGPKFALCVCWALGLGATLAIIPFGWFLILSSWTV